MLTIVDAATEVFAQTGFAAAQMVDVARMAGVSVGTLYNYVEGKSALLLLCAERPFTDITQGRELPVPTPDRVELIARLDETLVNHVHVVALDRALRTPLHRTGREVQLAEIVGELFDLISATRPTSVSCSTGGYACGCSSSSSDTAAGCASSNRRRRTSPPRSPRGSSSRRSRGGHGIDIETRRRRTSTTRLLARSRSSSSWQR